MSFSEITRKIANSLIGVFSNEKKHKKAMFQPRRLHIDPLEERQLLSVNVVMPQEKMLTSFSELSSPTITGRAFHILSNDSYGGATSMESIWSNDYMASNNQGDTVIVWSQNDFVYRMDKDGNYVEDKDGNRVLMIDNFGNAYDDYNIYAQYLTNQVERLTIPEELLTNNVAGSFGSFDLVYAPYTVQKLSIKSITSTDVYSLMGTGPNVVMEFQLGGEDTTGNGIADYTATILFNENLSPYANARKIQNELNNLGGIYADVTVTAESTTDFLITFGEAARLKYGTEAVPELEVRDTRVLQGNFPGILITTESAPIVLTTKDSWGNSQGILVDPGNPQLTAERIQQAFNSNTRLSPFPRVETYTRDIIVNPNREYVNMNSRPSYDVFYTSEVSVTYVNVTTFDITFINSSGLSFQNILLASAKDEWGTELVNTVAGMPSAEYTTTVKKSSDAFRVNAPEANDPYSSVPLVTNQMNASVAMDADGDFVITWQSEAVATGNTTISDIYARRFSPQGWLADTSKISFYDDGYTAERYVGGVANNPVQGVRPVGDQFKVNSFSNGYAVMPSIGMDCDGNFVIAWSTSYQKTSEGNAIYARLYDRYGVALTDSQIIDTEIRCPLLLSTVAISNDGYVALAWVNTDDLNAANSQWINGIYMSIFSPGSLTPMPNWNAVQPTGTGTFSPSLSFDSHNNLLLTYTDAYAYTGIKGTYGAEMSDVMARIYSLSEGTGTFELAREDFRIHGKGDWVEGDQYPDEYWRGPQFNGVGRFDSAGNMIFTYQGYGPDSNMSPSPMDYYFNIPGSYFTSYINEYKNSDLQQFFNPKVENFIFTTPGGYLVGGYSTSDVDMAIRYYLARAIRENPNITNDQIARLNAVFETVVGTMRGGANDVFTTRVNKGDFDPPQHDLIAISSDANMTSTRDGVNSHWYILIPNFIGEYPTGAGGINLYVSTEFHSLNSANMTIDFPVDNNLFVASEYAWRLYCALNSLNPQNGLYANNAFTSMLAPGFVANGLVMPSAEVFYYAPGQFESIYGDFYTRMGDGFMYSNILGYLGQDMYDPDLAGYHVYEIVFVGGAHDLEVMLSTGNGTNVRRYQYPNNPNFSGYMSMVPEHYGYRGAEKGTPGLSVLPNGSYVTSWFTDVTTTNGMVVDKKINYRYFQQNQDNVGPKVTDVILPNGQYVANQQMVTYSLEHLVVTVDKELLANGVNGTHSVLNPNNWSIIKDGVRLNNVIKSISFGTNMAKDIIDANPNSIVADSYLSLGSNKWEVVIEFKEALGTGSYELIASNMLCDTTGVSYTQGRPVYNNGNALGSDGTNPNGRSFSRNFNIVSMDGTLSFNGGSSGTTEKLVSTSSGDNYTRTGETKDDTPKNPTAVASDQNGNFVTVWTAETGGGIMARIYRQEFIDTGNGRESITRLISEIQVTNNPNASYASVAMDADGDFVVTWMQDDLDGRNIYAKAYNFNGSTRLDANGNSTSEFRVNSHTNGQHNYPAIAIDLDGSFVITWESLNQSSKTGGYDIYFQRYDSSCTQIGGVDSIQGIVFKGDPSPGGTFQLRYVDEEANISKTTANIAIGVTLKETAQNIKKALTDVGLTVEVGVSNDTVLVQFTGAYGARAIAPLLVVNPKLQNQKAGQSITVTQMTTGASGETRANDTLLGDKRYPAIAMAVTGEFTITWTSWGQGADSAYQSNIYAKNFPSNDAVASRHNQISLAERIEMMEAEYDYKTFLTTADSPDNHETPSDEYTGVVYIYATFSNGATYVGSGSLLSSGMHILTAAHVVFDLIGSPLVPQDILVQFETANGFEMYQVTQNYVHPSFTGNYTNEVDLAVLTLARLAPEKAERYDLYRGSDELGTVMNIAGYGTAGTGATGNVLPTGTRRSGYNRYEALGTIFDDTFNPNTLAWDFDSGRPQNDAFGYYFGMHDLGLGAALESSIAGGDSGGPSFIDGRIAGVHSYGGPMYPNSPVDAVPGVNGSFGEFAVDVRVSAYTDWIDAIMVTGGAGTSEYLVNQTELGNQIWSDVAISMSGEMVFTWTSFNQSGAGDGPGGSSNDISGVYARRFNLDGTPVTDIHGGYVVGDEFRVNDYIVGNQWYSSVSMANNGDFMIAWESYQDKSQVTNTLPDTGYGVGGTVTETRTDFGVYAKRFTNLETLLNSQDNPGGAQYGLPDTMRFIPGYGYVGIHGEVGTEFRINTGEHLRSGRSGTAESLALLSGDQTGATVALNANGDAIIVFQSQEQSGSKVYYRTVLRSDDQSAPIVTETVLWVSELKIEDGEFVIKNGKPDVKEPGLMPVRDDSIIYGYATHMVVTFSEEMFNAYEYSTGSIRNPANWQLSRDGVVVFGAIVDIQFKLDAAYDHKDLSLQSKSGKYEVVITFDKPLKSGNYLLTIRDNVTNVAGNNLDGNYDGREGGNFTRNFMIVIPADAEDETGGGPGDDGQDHKDGPKEIDKSVFNAEYGNDKPAVASTSDGSYVVVAVHYGEPGTPNEPDLLFDIDPIYLLPRVGNIVMQRYDKNGDKLGPQQIVNNYLRGHQTDPDVAMDDQGNIAVVWSGYGPNGKNGIYLRMYSSNDKTLAAQCDQIWVNEVSSTICSTPKVAYDNHGNVVVTWVEYNATTRSQVVMARVYNSKGVQQNVAFNGAASSKASLALVAENNLSVTNTPGIGYAYDIAFAPNGELILTWQMHNAATNSQDIYAKVLTYTGGQLNNKVNAFVVNQYTTLTQARPSVAACGTGFVITWVSDRQSVLKDRPDLKSDTYDIYARRFNLNGVAQPILGTTSDCLINTQKVFSEKMNPRDYPDVSMAPCGNFVITWSSYDQEPNNYDPDANLGLGMLLHDYASFARAFNSNGGDLKKTDPSGKGGTANFMPYTSTNEFRMNFTTIGNQRYSVATISDYGMSFAWVGETELTTWVYDDVLGGYFIISFDSIDVFTRAYTVRSNTTSLPGTGLGGYARSSYSVAQPSGGGGYIGQGTNTYKYDNQSTLFLDGTNGNDKFEIIVTASGFLVTVNDKPVNVGSKVRNIQIDGLGGQLSIISDAGDNSAKLNAEDNLVSFSSKNGTFTISALRMDKVELKVGGKNNSLQVVASANDVLSVGANDLSLTGEKHSYAAQGFDLVSAMATASSASAILYDSAGDDVLTMKPQYAVMKGQEFENSVSGFGNITAYSTRGNNMAYLHGSTGDDAVFASGSTVTLAGRGYKNTIFGFDKAFVIGNGGNDSATLVGSYAADRFTGTDTLMEAVFGRNSTVNFYGFRNFSIYGNGGNDVMALSNISQVTDINPKSTIKTYQYQNTLANISYTVTGINDVRGIQQQAPASSQAASAAMAPLVSETLPASVTSDITTAGTTPKASSAAFSEAIHEDDIYQLLALEHEQNSKKTADDDLVNALDIDYLLKIGAL